MKDITVLIHTSGNKTDEERTLKTVKGWIRQVLFVRSAEAQRRRGATKAGGRKPEDGAWQKMQTVESGQ